MVIAGRRAAPKAPMRSGRGARLASDVAFVVGALIGRDCGHIRVSELRTERRHHGGICHARDRLALESVQNRLQMLGRIPRCSDGSLAFTVALPASGGKTPAMPWPVSWWHDEQ